VRRDVMRNRKGMRSRSVIELLRIAVRFLFSSVEGKLLLFKSFEEVVIRGDRETERHFV